jgi:hypothetical protein
LAGNYILFTTHHFPVTTDFPFHYGRIIGLSQNLRQGNWVYGINTFFLNGYGYPVDLFYAPLFLYPMATMLALGLSASAAWPSYYVIITFATLCLAYYSARSLFPAQPILAYVFAGIYTFSMYHLIDMYYRVGLGTIIAYMFIPLILASFILIYRRNYNRDWICLALGMTGVMYAHFITTALVGGCLLLAFVTRSGVELVSRPQVLKPHFLAMLKAVVLWLGLSAAYLWPMLQQLRSYHTVVSVKSMVTFGAGEESMSQFFINSLTMAPYARLTASVLILVLLLLRVVLPFKKRREDLVLADNLLIIGLILTFLGSATFWQPDVVQALAFVTRIQFAWRFGIISTACLCFAAATYTTLALQRLTPNKQIHLGTAILVMVLAIVTLSQPFTAYQELAMASVAKSKPYSNSIGAGREYLPIDTDTRYLDYHRTHKAKLEVIQDNSRHVQARNLNIKGSNLAVHVTTTKATVLTLPLIAYLGYHATLNGQDLFRRSGPNHLLQVDLPAKAKGVVRVAYNGTRVQLLSLGITWLTLVALLGYEIWLNVKARGRLK